MKGRKEIFTLRHMLSSLFMVATLFWLTVSTPFVFAAQQQRHATEKTPDEDRKNCNPFSNTTEERSETSVNSLSEYLHDHEVMEHPVIILPAFHKCHPSDLYFAFHPELISPPPEA
jgi:cytoskeletal protein RodZ